MTFEKIMFTNVLPVGSKSLVQIELRTTKLF